MSSTNFSYPTSTVSPQRSSNETLAASIPDPLINSKMAVAGLAGPGRKLQEAHLLKELKAQIISIASCIYTTDPATLDVIPYTYIYPSSNTTLHTAAVISYHKPGSHSAWTLLFKIPDDDYSIPFGQPTVNEALEALLGALRERGAYTFGQMANGDTHSMIKGVQKKRA